jgi:hypothetical protein
MKKVILMTILLFTSNQVFAETYTLVCKKTKDLISFYHQEAASVECGNTSSIGCRNEFSSQLNQQYGSITGACEKILGGNWYYDYLKSSYD